MYGPNPYYRYGSYGPSGTLAYGRVPDTYSYGYDITYKEYELPAYNGFYGNVLTGGQDREYYERVYTYWRVKYGRYGNEINRYEVRRESFIDFDAWGALSGVKQKDRFVKPNGFGKFATEWADAWGNISISIGGSISGPTDDIRIKPFFIEHPNEDDPTDVLKEMNDREKAIDSAVKAKMAVNNAIKQYIANDPSINRNPSKSTPETAMETPIQVLEPTSSDTLQVTQLVFASTTDIVAYDPNLMKSISEVYKLIADEQSTSLSVISETNGAYLSVGDVVTSDYIMSFAKDAINVEPGTYRLIDIDIIDIQDKDWLGNSYEDPERILATMPALNALMYFSRVTED